MCGILCVFNKDGIKQDKERYLASLRTMAHRGPDGEGAFMNRDIFIGHRRLAILDLSEKARQPMIGADGKVVIAYNGEIYNHLDLKADLKIKGYTFISTSDTEVFLNMYLEYGQGCFKMLRGMWAAVICDERDKTLIVSRDRLGLKPLYIYQGRDMVISSEIKAIIYYDRSACEADQVSLYKYITRGWMDDTASTFFRKIRSVEPGTFLSIKNGKVDCKRYWDLSILTDKSRSPDDFLGKFKETLRLHMQSDVPVALSLSGGVDSSSIACVLSKSLDMGNRIHAFSVQPPFTQDETSWVNATVRHCGIKHSYLDISEGSYSSFIDETIKFHDEPVFSASQFYQMLLRKRVSEMGFKVILVGEGADEVLGGYAKLAPIYLASLFTAGLYKEFINALPSFREFTNQPPLKIILKALKFLYNRSGSRNVQEQRFGYDVLDKGFSFVDKNVFSRLNHRELDSVKDGKYFFQELLDRLQIDIRNILKMEDRDGMAYGVEVRPPYLDHELVEFAFSFPFSEFMKNGRNKFILREAVKDVLTPEVYNCRHKMVRPGNNGHVVYDSLASEIRDLLRTKNFSQMGIWNKDCAEWFESDFKKRDYHHAFVWFRVYMLNKWRQLWMGV